MTPNTSDRSRSCVSIFAAGSSFAKFQLFFLRLLVRGLWDKPLQVKISAAVWRTKWDSFSPPLQFEILFTSTDFVFLKDDRKKTCAILFFEPPRNLSCDCVCPFLKNELTEDCLKRLYLKMLYCKNWNRPVLSECFGPMTISTSLKGVDCTLYFNHYSFFASSPNCISNIGQGHVSTIIMYIFLLPCDKH